jgi:hypothetical protein
MSGKTEHDDRKIVSLDEHRIRVEREFEDNSVAYVEALWGEETFAFNAAIRDLEGMRRGQDDGSLRPPETTHEAISLVLHCRSLANDLARHFGLDHMVREHDDVGKHAATVPIIGEKNEEGS